MERIVLIENVLTHGAHAKELLARALSDLGYKILVFGKNTNYSDYYVPLDENLSNKTICIKPEDLYNSKYGHLNLWDQVKGSFGYLYPEFIEGLPSSESSLLIELFKKYSLICENINILLKNTEIEFGLIWGGMFLEGRAVKNTFESRGVRTFATEFSFDKDRLYFDVSGEIGNRHSFSKPFTLPSLPQDSLDRIDQWILNNYSGKQKQQAKRGDLDSVRKEYRDSEKLNLLLLCQCYIDTVVTMDNPYFVSTIDAYKFLFSKIDNQSENINLIIKLHPGDKEEYKEKIINIASKNGIKIADNINVYTLMDAMDAGITINSQAGLEMLAKGKRVLTLGDAFYSGHGFCSGIETKKDLSKKLKELIKEPALSKIEILKCKSYLYSLLFEELIDLNHIKDQIQFKIKGLHSDSGVDIVPNVLIIHPSPRFGGSGYYMQELAFYLKSNGANVLVLSEGSCPPNDSGIRWVKLKFKGPLLTRELKNIINEFSPNVIYQVGVRTKPMRAALECYVAHRCMFMVQAEDDEFVPFDKHSPYPNRFLLNKLDKPELSKGDVVKFLKKIDWEFTYKVMLDPGFYRWVEPIMRVVCYRLAVVHTGIWYPICERLNKKYSKETFVIPPFITLSNYTKIQFSENEISNLLRTYKIPSDSYIYFVNGTIYDFTSEFEQFLNSLVALSSRTDKKLTLVIAGRGRGNLQKLAKKKLKGKVYYRSLGVADDLTYNMMMKASHVICAPGYNDEFNRYRLSSRLVKAMAVGKPVFTFHAGLGEWLEKYNAAFLTKTDDLNDWIDTLEKTLDSKLCEKISINGKKFAERHFDAPRVVKMFYDVINLKLKMNEGEFTFPKNIDYPVSIHKVKGINDILSVIMRKLSLSKKVKPIL